MCFYPTTLGRSAFWVTLSILIENRIFVYVIHTSTCRASSSLSVLAVKDCSLVAKWCWRSDVVYPSRDLHTRHNGGESGEVVAHWIPNSQTSSECLTSECWCVLFSDDFRSYGTCLVVCRIKPHQLKIF